MKEFMVEFSYKRDVAVVVLADSEDEAERKVKHAKTDIDRLIDEAGVCFSSSFIEVQSVEEVKDGDDYWPY